jgi:hypothetical protein
VDFRRVIEMVADFFEREKLPFAVIGAFGLHVYGLTRATTDVDFVTDSAARLRLVRFLEANGYETLYKSEGYSNHLHPDSGFGRVDIVYVSGETGNRLFAGASPRSLVPGRRVPVPRPEHLAAMKIHAIKNDPGRRHQEIADIRFLMGLPGVDRDEIRGYFEASGLERMYEDLEQTL